MQKSMTQQGVVIAIVLLFVGIAIVPSINFTVVKASSDNERVNVTIEACGIKGVEPRTVSLTTDEINTVKQLLHNLQSKVNNAKTNEEVLTVFNEAVVALDQYGLLPQGMTVHDAQMLVTGKSLNNNKMKSLNKLPDNSSEKWNLLCFTMGTVPLSMYITPLLLLCSPLILLAFAIMLITIEQGFPPDIPFATSLMLLGYALFYAGALIGILNPISLGYTAICSGGNVTTLGLLGVQSSQGNSSVLFGFTGLKIMINTQTFETFLLGFSLASVISPSNSSRN